LFSFGKTLSGEARELGEKLPGKCGLGKPEMPFITAVKSMMIQDYFYLFFNLMET